MDLLLLSEASISYIINILTGIPFLFRGYGRPLEEVRGTMYKTGRI